MHELSIAKNIVEIVEEEAKVAGADSVGLIVLEIGSMSGVIKDAMTFALTEAVKGTILNDSEFQINEIEAEAVCDECKKQFMMNELYQACPSCGNFYSDIIKGKELNIKSININKK